MRLPFCGIVGTGCSPAGLDRGSICWRPCFSGTQQYIREKESFIIHVINISPCFLSSDGDPESHDTQEIQPNQQEVTDSQQEVTDSQQEVTESQQEVSESQQEVTESIPEVSATEQEMAEVGQEMEVEANQDEVIQSEQNVSEVIPEISVSEQDVSEVTQDVEMREETTEEVVGGILSSLISQVVGSDDHTHGYLDPTQSITQQILDSPSKDKYQVL